jgi:hypothetical protein
MHDRISVPVAHRLPGVRVHMDAHVWEAWNARGLPRNWFFSERGPAFWGPGGKAQMVAETILGRPCKLGPDGPHSVCLSNLIPLDGTEADTAGLDAIPVANADDPEFDSRVKPEAPARSPSRSFPFHVNR